MKVISATREPGRLTEDRDHRMEENTRLYEAVPSEKKALDGNGLPEIQRRYAAKEVRRYDRVLELPSEYFIG